MSQRNTIVAVGVVVIASVVLGLGTWYLLDFSGPAPGRISNLSRSGQNIRVFWVPSLGDAQHGFPYLSGAGRLVVKDAIMMGAALVTMADSAKAYLRKRAFHSPSNVVTKERLVTASV